MRFGHLHTNTGEWSNPVLLCCITLLMQAEER